jgi:hypothetical protein
MLIEVYCRLLGKSRTMDLPVTEEQLKRWQAGELAQFVFPHLTPDQREFLITGLMPGEFDKIVAGEALE